MKTIPRSYAAAECEETADALRVDNLALEAFTASIQERQEPMVFLKRRLEYRRVRFKKQVMKLSRIRIVRPFYWRLIFSARDCRIPTLQKRWVSATMKFGIH